jgi:hypothetical protein
MIDYKVNGNEYDRLYLEYVNDDYQGDEAANG